MNSVSTSGSIADRYFIPARPDVLVTIQTVLTAEEPDLALVAELISADVSLAGEVLKLINSPFYGLPVHISNIGQSVMLIGLEALNSIIISSFMKRGFNKSYSIKLERFWDEAEAIAKAMMFIGDRLTSLLGAGELLKEKIPLESLYALGLFHDCGIPPLADKHEDYKELLIHANENLISSVELEDERYSTSHATVGYYICKYWGLPSRICNLVRSHHESDFLLTHSDATDQLYFATLKTAENMVYEHFQDKTAPEWGIFQESVMDRLNLTDEDYVDLFEDYVSALNS